jgi:hypothetical protein
MKMLHATPARNIRSIVRSGIKASRSKGAAQTVWLVAPGMSGAALSHAMKRHSKGAIDVCILEIDVPRSWLRKGRRKGLWHTGGRDIPPGRIKGGVVLLRYTIN